MPLTVSNNSAVASASYYLGKNQSPAGVLRNLPAERKIIGPNEDPGTLSVPMKVVLQSPGWLGQKIMCRMQFPLWKCRMASRTVGRVVNRMAELKHGDRIR